MVARRFAGSRPFRFSIATAVVLAGCAMLAVVSGGRAGSAKNEFVLVVQPHVLSTEGTGFAMGKFTAAPGPGTGSATHVVIEITLPTGLEPASSGTSSDCTDPDPDDSVDTFTCNIGTVLAGQIVKRFVTFTAPATVAPPFETYTVLGKAKFDRGSGGIPGGGGFDEILGSDSTDVYAKTDRSNAGNCLSSGYTITTPPVNAADTQGTFMSFGPAASSLPCTWAELGEGQAPASFKIPQISFVTAPVFAKLATLTISIYQLPLSKIGTLKEFPNYPNLIPALDVLECPSPTSLPPGRDACELPRSKNGNVTLLTLLFSGTGVDPGFGGG